MRNIVIFALLGAIFCGCAWGLEEFVSQYVSSCLSGYCPPNN